MLKTNQNVSCVIEKKLFGGAGPQILLALMSFNHTDPAVARDFVNTRKKCRHFSVNYNPQRQIQQDCNPINIDLLDLLQFTIPCMIITEGSFKVFITISGGKTGVNCVGVSKRIKIVR